MFDKLEDLLIRFEEIMGELHEPTVTNNQERFRKLMKEQSDLTPIVDAYTEYKKCKQDIEDSLSMLEEEKDEEMRESYETTLKDGKKDNAVAFLKNISRKEVERKRSVTFSITESQLNKMDKAARQNGFKNRSEFLASIIDAI